MPKPLNTEATVAVFGAGSWGTALAIQLSRNGLQVNLWGHRPDHIERLIREGENAAYLPGIELDKNIRPTTSIEDCLRGAQIALIAIPSKTFREFLRSLKPRIPPDMPVFWASKGFEIESGNWRRFVTLPRLIQQDLVRETLILLEPPLHNPLGRFAGENMGLVLWSAIGGTARPLPQEDTVDPGLGTESLEHGVQGARLVFEGERALPVILPRLLPRCLGA